MFNIVQATDHTDYRGSDYLEHSDPEFAVNSMNTFRHFEGFLETDVGSLQESIKKGNCMQLSGGTLYTTFNEALCAKTNLG